MPRQRFPFRLDCERLEDRLTPATLPAGFTETPLATGLTSPTAMELAPDGRIFIAEQGGTLRVVTGSQLQAAPFLILNVSSQGERGLLGIAFDPNFASNRFFYVYYTTATSPIHNRVSRFTAGDTAAVPGSEIPIVELDNLSSATNHNGGAIHFGPDGKLYIAVGDNAQASNAQTFANPFGKMLRVNPDGTVPQDNPFFAQATGGNRAIWALGLRNPFTFAFQPGTGRMFINDVGQSAFEEINDGIAGENYGWPAAEGPANPPNPSFRDPFYFYANDAQTCAIGGGAFYNPTTNQFPSDYAGDYFFGDLCAGWIKRIDVTTRQVSDFATGVPGSVDVKVGPDGSLYYLAFSTGQLVRVQFPAGIPGPNPSPPPSPSLPPPPPPSAVSPRSTVGVFDPAAATWYIRNRNDPGAPDLTPFAYGSPGWIPVVGDWDGDGRQTIGVFDPATATWYLRNANSPGAPDFTPFAYGSPGWIPVVGDWDGNGTTTVGVVDPTTMTWYLRNRNDPGAADLTPFAYGAPGWVPVVGDWDGNRTDTLGVFDGSTATWYIRNSNSPGAPDITPFAYGGTNWVPVAGDWDGNGSDSIGVYDPGAVWYLKNDIAPGAPSITPFAYGVGTWVPAPGEWNPPTTRRAAGGPGPGAASLTQPELDGVVAAAFTRFGAGAPAAQFGIKDLGDDNLGLAFEEKGTVWIDDDAAGYGWFVDPTPLEDSEFVGCMCGSPAKRRMDLLSVVLHELGHLAGLPDLDPAAHPDDLMAATLPTGTRRA